MNLPSTDLYLVSIHVFLRDRLVVVLELNTMKSKIDEQGFDSQIVMLVWSSLEKDNVPRGALLIETQGQNAAGEPSTNEDVVSNLVR